MMMFGPSGDKQWEGGMAIFHLVATTYPLSILLLAASSCTSAGGEPVPIGYRPACIVAGQQISQAESASRVRLTQVLGLMGKCHFPIEIFALRGPTDIEPYLASCKMSPEPWASGFKRSLSRIAHGT